MVRLSAEQQKEYEEELEYARENETIHVPGKAKRSAYDKIASAANKAYNAGARVAEGVSAIGQNPHIRQMSQQSGFINRNIPPAQPRHATARQQYAGAPVHDNSVMHPGNRIVVMRCSGETGQCKTIATGISEERPRQPRQARRPRYYQGGLGEGDYGL